MIRLVCSDIDGTLVTEGGDVIAEEYLELIRELLRRGILFAAASGRQYDSIARLLEPVKDEIIYIAEGGCLIMYQGRMLDVGRLEFSDVLSLGQMIEELPGCYGLFSSPKCSFCLAGAKGLYRKMTEEYRYSMRRIDTLERMENENIIKVSLFREKGNVEEIYDKIPGRWKHHPNISCVCSGWQWYDFTHRNSNKGKAVSKLQGLFGISPEETMVFGDNKNDLPMFAAAAHSYAVANASEEVRLAAGNVVSSMQEQGVLKKLRELLFF